MSLDQPTPPDPVATANAQQGLNRDSAKYQAEINAVNQSTPYGSLKYSQTGTYDDGTPIFTATSQLSPTQQSLLDTTTGTQQKVATSASDLASSLGSALTSAPNLDPSAVTEQMMGWQHDYMQPIFDQQQSNLDAKLASQGVTQGSQAYGNAQNLQARNVDNAYEGAMANDEGQAFAQALAKYQAPIATLGTLLGEGQPANVGTSLVQTPQEQIQPANYSSLAEQNYAQQNQQYGNTMSGLFSIPSAVLGGWARGGFTSDIRAKKDISKVGRLDDGTPIYRFRYKDESDPEMRIGVMAQEIEPNYPDAVFEGDDGYKRVDYERLTDRVMERAHG